MIDPDHNPTICCKRKRTLLFYQDGAIKRRGNSCERLINSSEEFLLKPKSPNLVMRLVRRYDQDERETDGAVHWSSLGPKLRLTFQKA